MSLHSSRLKENRPPKFGKMVASAPPRRASWPKITPWDIPSRLVTKLPWSAGCVNIGRGVTLSPGFPVRPLDSLGAEAHPLLEGRAALVGQAVVVLDDIHASESELVCQVREFLCRKP